MDGTEIKIFRNKNCLIFFRNNRSKKNSMISSFQRIEFFEEKMMMRIKMTHNKLRLVC